jgi:hypothetical protein
MNVFELFATLGLDTSEYDKGLDESEKKGSSFGQNIGKVIGTGAKVAGAALAATGAAAIGAGKAFADSLQATAEIGDAIDKNSQRLGISAEKYQQLDYVLNIAGTSMSEVSMGMKTLTNQLDAAKGGSEEAQAKFAALGISMDDLSTMSREDIFEATIAGFQNMEESVERASLANDLLGRSSLSLTPLFNMTNEETKELIATATEYGMVMSDDAVKASAGFQDSLTTLTRTMNGLKNNMLSTFLPSVSTVMDGLSAVFAGDDSGLGKIDQGVQDFINNLNTQMPKILELGGRIISSLLSAISKNLPSLLREGSHVLSELIQGIILALPSLLESAMIIIETIGSALLDNAELLLNTGLDLLLTLMAGITENLPTIIPAITSVIVMIITTLTAPDNLNAFIQGALALIMALADGIVIALPQLVAVIPTVIDNLVSALIENAPLVLKTALYLLGALTVALLKSLVAFLGEAIMIISNKFSDIFNKSKDFGRNIRTWLSNGVTNIKNSISNFFISIGNFFSNGFQNIKNKVNDGLNAVKTKFTSIFDNVKNVVRNAIEFIKGLFKFEWSLPKIKLPHFSISGKLDLLAVPPQIPSVSVEWYKKAMNQPYMLNGATIFGAAGGKLLGGGESGSEMVIGTNKLMSMMREASMGGRDIVINVYGSQGQDIRQLAKEVGKELQNVLNNKEKVYA